MFVEAHRRIFPVDVEFYPASVRIPFVQECLDVFEHLPAESGMLVFGQCIQFLKMKSPTSVCGLPVRFKGYVACWDVPAVCDMEGLAWSRYLLPQTILGVARKYVSLNQY